MSWPKRLKKVASLVSTATFASAGSRPSSESSFVAWGSTLMPTPIGLISGADDDDRVHRPAQPIASRGDGAGSVMMRLVHHRDVRTDARDGSAGSVMMVHVHRAHHE